MRSPRADTMEFLFIVTVLAVVLLAVHDQCWGQVPRGALSAKREYTAIARSEWGLLAPVATMAAQIEQESGWRDGLTSRVGARGLGQFMPATAEWMNRLRPDLAHDAMYSPAWSMRAQNAYMKWLHVRVKADSACERMAFALSAYNGGLGYVYRRQKAAKQPGRCLGYACEINPGITPASQKENRDYPRRILLALEPRYYRAGWGVASCGT